jgi:hypothetical protein
MEPGDPRCIDFVTSEDNGNIMARECRIIVHRCLLERLIKVDGSI